jgi:hypothetical protein
LSNWTCASTRALFLAAISRGTALAIGASIERGSDARSDAAPIWRTIMKKLTSLVPVALLATLAGCNGATANDASENLGEAAQATTVAGSWSGLPVTGNAQWAVCSVSYNGIWHSFQMKLDSVESSSVNVYDTLVYLTDSDNNIVYSTATQTNYALSAGGTMNFSDSDDSYFQLVAGTDAHGNMTLTVENGYFSYDGLQTSCTAHVMNPTASASGVGLLGTPWIGSVLTGYYTFADDDGLSESGSTYQWYTVSGGTATAISGATSTSYTVGSATLGDTIEFCVTPADANGKGVQVCSSPTSASAAYSAVASDVAIAGNPFVGSTLTGSYTFSDGAHLSETSAAYQWYTVSGSTLTAISGATSETYSPTTYDVNNQIELCVTPSDSFGPGAQACSSAVTVAGVVWYSGESWTGTAIGETSSNGTCVNVSSLGLGFTPMSLALASVDDTAMNLNMYTGSGCTGTVYNRTAGAGTVHDINLDSVGIGSNLVSYKITW